jgi:hypothetical protein
MSNKNPKIVVDSILNSNGEDINSEIKVYPMTIRRYALFEKLNSPFINSDVKFDVSNIIPSVYVMCSTKEKLKEYSSNDIEKLISDAFDWSEDLSMNDIPKMITSVTKQMEELNRASPDATDNNSKKK